MSGILSGIAAELAAKIIEVAGKETLKRFGKTERQKAFEACLAEGLAEAEKLLPHDLSGLTKYYVEQFKQFLPHETTAKQLTILLEPTELNEQQALALKANLYSTFVDITQGYKPEQIPDFPNFEQFTIALFKGFYEAAKRSDFYQESIKITRLDTLVGSMSHLLTIQSGQLNELQKQTQLLGELLTLAKQNNQAPNPTIIDVAPIARLIERLEQQQLPAPSPQLPAPKIPVDLPPETERFTGRATLVQQVIDAVQLNRVVTLWGPGGRGKTALAWRALSNLQEQGELTQRFADGVLFHSFYGRPNIADCLTYVAQSLGIDEVRDPVGACQRALSGKQVLMILDGAEDCEDLRPILELRGACGVLITTRNQQQAPQAENVIAVNALERADAYALIKSWAGELAADEAALDAICDHVGNLALAVRLAARTMAQNQMTATDYWGWLQEEPIDALYIDDTSRSRNVDRLIHKTVAQVSDDSQTILHLAANLAYLPFGWHVLSGTLPDWKRSDLNRTVQQLADFGLLNRNEDGSIALTHSLVYSYIRNAPQQAGTDQILQSVSTYFTEYVRQETIKGLQGFTSLDFDRAHIISILNLLAIKHIWNEANNLALTIGYFQGYLVSRGYVDDLITTLKIGIEATRNLDDLNNLQFHIGGLGNALLLKGEIDEAITNQEKALSISQEIGDRGGESVHLGNLATIKYRLGLIPEMITLLQQALAICKELNDSRGASYHLGNLGLAYARQGGYRKSLEYYEQSLSISQMLGDKRSESNALGSIAMTYHQLGDFNKAATFLRQAIFLCRETGNRLGEAISLGNLGLAHAAMGNSNQALKYYEEAIQIKRDIGDRSGEAIDLANIGKLKKAQGKITEARICWINAYTIFHQLQSPYADSVQRLLNDFPLE